MPDSASDAAAGALRAGVRVPATVDGAPGTMAAAVRAFDWASTPLGPIERWSPTLRTTVDLVLASGFAMSLFWGPDLIAIHNDRFRRLLGGKRGALGAPLRVTWAEAWDRLRPIAERALAGESTFIEDFLVPVDRDGRLQDAYFTFAYSPVHDGDGRVVGMLDTVIETTSTVDAVRAARRERDRQHRLLQQMPGFVAVLEGADHRFAYANDAYVALAGGRALIGRPMREALPELADDPDVIGALDRVRETGQALAVRAAPLRLRGETATRHVDRLYAPIRDDAGRVEGILVSGHDVSEHLRTEAELRASQTRLARLNADLEREVAGRTHALSRVWQVSPELLGVLGADGRFAMTNPAWGRILGWSEAEVEAVPFLEFVHPDDVEATRQAWREAIEHGAASTRVVSRWRTKDGRWRWLSWVGAPEGGRCYCSARDVTEERQRAEQLAERTTERDLLARIVETTNAFVQVLDRDLRVVALNRSCADEHERGFGRRLAVGMTLHEYFADRPEHLRDALSVWQRVLAGEHFTVVGRFGEASRRRRTYEITFETLRDAEGRVTLAYSTATDVTERLREQAQLVQAQQELRQAQKMEAVGQLTGGLAHDFNNLLAAIGASVELAQRRLAAGRADELQRYLETARRSLGRAASLTHRLLAFSRRQTLDPRPLDVVELARGLHELVQRTVGPQIAVVVRDDGAGAWPVHADAGQLENALLNLCINARDAMPDGGQLSVEVSGRGLDDVEARTLGLAAGDYVQLCVVDTGTGMTPDVVARAFDPFFTTKPAGSGTGLGLSMVHGFAGQSGGHVSIASQPGHGTTVCLLLPRRSGQAAPASAAVEAPAAPADVPTSEAAAARREATIVVVDDEAPLREMVGEALREAGWRVRLAGDGAEALRVFSQPGDVALLVTDFGLPGGMNGRELADLVTARRPGLCTLFITGYADGAVLGDAGERRHVMTKPFELEALVAKVGELARTHA